MATGDSTRPGRGRATPLTVDELHDHDTGRWQITTHTSIYLLDLDHRRVTRFPGTAGEHGIHTPPGIIYVVRTLPGDRRPLALERLIRCRCNEPLHLLLDLDDLEAPLVSTPIREIRRLAPQR